MAYFDGIKIGDKIWTIPQGACTVVAIRENEQYPIVTDCDDFTIGRKAYTMDGLWRTTDRMQSAFWSRPEIKVPPKPKRMVEKQFFIAYGHFDDGIRNSTRLFGNRSEAEDATAGLVGWRVKPIMLEVEE